MHDIRQGLTDIEAPTTNTKEPSLRIPTTERHTYLALPTMAPRFIVLLVLAVFVIDPDRMPEYAAKLAKLIKQLRALADTAKVQLREQMGPDFGDVDWKQCDPRQYDPRRIVREALLDSGSDGGQPGDGQHGGFRAPSSFKRHDPDQPTPHDQEARDSPIRWVPVLAIAAVARGQGSWSQQGNP
jgi:sec-independent protein translocase protein TatB